MDHLELFKTMSVRRLVMWAFLGLGITLLVALGTAWLIIGSVTLLGAVASIVVMTVLIGFTVDRMLAARLFDKSSLPARPEYTDFDLYNHPMHLEELGGRPLKSLSYVVFDTETTGLRPSHGDEIISIAGVRVIDGEIKTGDPFTRLVNPGRDIPKASIRFHGITEEMVEGEAALYDVLPEFRDFVGDAILVAHNAAFDMKFLKLKEAETGVVFDNLVLDSLLLSVFVESESKNHSLDAIAERLGVEVEGRHTALGDSLVTARVFLRMLDMLEARGIRTLRQAIDVSMRISHVRARQDQF